MALIHLTNEAFDKATASGLAMVDFWATWCGPCKMLSPVIDGLADRCEGQVLVGKVNTDEQPELAIRFGVMSIPTVIFLKDGKEIEPKVGVMPGQLHRSAGRQPVNRNAGWPKRAARRFYLLLTNIFFVVYSMLNIDRGGDADKPFLVLGLLDGGPMSGYDLQQKLGGADAERWGGVLPGSIYHALKKLEGEGCIALAGVEQTGHRQKAVYRITEAGRNHLHTLIADALRASSALYPTTLYSALSLADKLPPAEVRLALEEQRRRLEAEYAALERGRAGNEGQEVPPLARITIDNMVDIVQRQRRCVEELLAAVGEAP